MAKEKNENNETPVQPAKNVEKELLDALEALKNEYAALGKTLEDTKAELNARNDSYVRITADYENYRKRTAAEKAATYAEAYAGAAELFLPMADALERASELAPEDKGVDALRKQLSDIFGRLGITEIESDGKPFDPELHNAIQHEDDETQPESTVVQTFQRGYRLGDKVIRHAMVKVIN